MSQGQIIHYFFKNKIKKILYFKNKTKNTLKFIIELLLKGE